MASPVCGSGGGGGGGYEVRRLDTARDDARAIAALLGELSSVDEALGARDVLEERSARVLCRDDNAVVLCVHERVTGDVVAMGTVLFEYKFTHAGGCVAHIEDVVVTRRCRGKGVGKLLVCALLDVARSRAHCYKVSLNCSAANVAFYEKVGLQANGEVRMVSYL